MATDDPTHLDSVFPWLLKPPVPLASEDDSSVVEVGHEQMQIEKQPEVELAAS